MKLGDQITARPLFGGATGESEGEPQKGVVVYIHPKERFFTLEFVSSITGEKFRESFPMMRVCGGEVPVERAHLDRKKNRYGEALYR